ncbi:MAG TPA: glycerol-3-phosphate dehydrogenase/oxidase [Dehalococcoidia bacterium]|nr:glycerol-3-phosphate dehydrogenase/oxidase [Dehalococcoidia bacterium]
MTVGLEGVAGEAFDVVVIGGGINGAGIAREAQHAGYRTLLVERDDFGAGTTSRATRLIHGGLRYLEHGEFGLVYESLSERETLVRDAPYLVRPLQLLLPVYRGDARPAWMVRIGLTLYDLLSFRKSLPRHHALSRSALERYEPNLERDGLRAAYTFSDAQVEFPERLVVESVRDFTEAGGIALNHTSAVDIVAPGHKLRGVRLRETCGERTVEAGARVIVNAAGPWADMVLAGTDAERHERLIGGTKGSHLVAEWPDGPRHAIFATAKADGRPFFILPWYRYTLVGTTDLRYDGDPSKAQATAAEVAYLLDEASRLFPSTPLTREDVLYTYSGVRPLPANEHGTEAAITRRHIIIDHTKRGGPDGLLSVVGGKLTTYRSLARIALKAIEKHAKPSGAPAGEGRIEARATAPAFVPLEQDPLVIYGRRAGEVRALAEGDPALRERVCAHNPEILAQVAYAADREQAATLADALLRRLPAGWSRCHALDGAQRCAEVMAARLGWDGERVSAEVAAYERELRGTLVPLDAIEEQV